MPRAIPAFLFLTSAFTAESGNPASPKQRFAKTHSSMETTVFYVNPEE
jgi:hypothetical protein